MNAISCGEIATYTLSSPLLELEFEGRPPTWLIVVFYVVNIAVALGLLYGYAVFLPSLIGFETTILAGIGTIALGVGR